MMKVVRPAISSASARLISRSVLASTEEVASVEDQDAGVGEDRPGDRDALALPARHGQAALAHARVHSRSAALG